VLFELLKRVGALYIERTTENPLYGSFAVIVGLLVWINVVSRMFLICAAWTVTAPYDSDVPPSGTASPELAEKAGIPTEFADTDPDAAPALQQDGAPSPLAAAVQGVTPSQDVPEGRGSAPEPDRARDDRDLVGAGAPRTGPAAVRSVDARQAAKAQRAGHFTAGALGMLVTAVVLHVGRTMLDVVRR
jgi:membrane protein